MVRVVNRAGFFSFRDFFLIESLLNMKVKQAMAPYLRILLNNSNFLKNP